jgi:hypothetical protein
VAPVQQPVAQLIASQMHLPPEHRCPVAHTLPHAPQFIGSVCVFTSQPSERLSPLQSA